MKTWVKVLIGVIALAVVAVIAVPFVYINFIKDDAPKALSIDDAPVATDTGSATVSTDAPAGSTATTADPVDPVDTTDAGSATEGADGSYTITPDSQAGYRVVEVLFGQDTEGVGRTNSVTGTITVAGTQVTAAEFTVEMDTLESDESRRDNAFRDVMDTDEFPTATFVITQPIELGTISADGEEITASATGDLTLHGVTKSVPLDVTAKKTGDSIAIAGSTDVVFSDYDIDNPSRSGITTQDHGLIEFLLVASKG